ncbi:MAG: hypothetical protein ACYC5Y_13045 [Symbiobacteriia bacterium]
MKDRTRSLAALLASLAPDLAGLAPGLAALAAGTLVTALAVALLAWLPGLEAAYWPQVASYWFSREAVPFWVAVAALNLIAALLTPSWPWPHPGTGFVTGIVYGLGLLVRRTLSGATLASLLALRWQEILSLGLALAAGSWAAGATYSCRRQGRESAPPWRT